METLFAGAYDLASMDFFEIEPYPLAGALYGKAVDPYAPQQIRHQRAAFPQRTNFLHRARSAALWRSMGCVARCEEERCCSPFSRDDCSRAAHVARFSESKIAAQASSSLTFVTRILVPVLVPVERRIWTASDEIG
jgi:hypothetical protein